MKIQFDIPPEQATESNGLAVRYAATKRQVPRWRWYLLLATVLAVPVYLLVRFIMALLWANMPAQVMLEQTTVRAPASGVVATIAPIGAALRAGEVLAELDTSLPRSAPVAVAVPATAEGVAQAQAARANLLAEAERLALSRLKIQQERLRVMQNLYAHGAATRQEVDNLRFQELQAQADLSRARADIREYQALFERERLQFSALAATAGAGNSSANSLQVFAPFTSTVQRIMVHKGSWVVQGSEIATLQGEAEPLVYAYVPPDKERYAQVGKTATLRFLDGGKVHAKVVRVMAEAQSLPLERNSPLVPRVPAIVVCLQALEPLPAAYRIHQLPLNVRFDWVAGSLW